MQRGDSWAPLASHPGAAGQVRPPWGPAGPPRNPGKSPVKGVREYFFLTQSP